MSKWNDNKWTRRLVSKRWGPGILTKVEEPSKGIEGEFSEEPEVDYILTSDLKPLYKSEFLAWLSEKNLSPFIISRSIKKIQEEVVDDNINYAVNLEDWKEWLTWRIDLKNIMKNPKGIPAKI